MSSGPDYISESEFEELRGVYYSQAYEIIEALQDLLLDLESCPDNDETLKAIQRYFHTLKGDSNSIGLTKIGTFCHRVEDMLSVVREQGLHDGTKTTGLLFECVDIIDTLLRTSETGEDGTDISEIMGRIDVFMSAPEAERRQSPETGQPAHEVMPGNGAPSDELKTCRIDVSFHPVCSDRTISSFILSQRAAGLGQLISSSADVNSEEVKNLDRITFIVRTQSSPEQIHEALSMAGVTGEIEVTWQTDAAPEPSKTVEACEPRQGNKAPGLSGETLRVDVAKVDNLMNLVGELIIGRSIIEQVLKDSEEGLTAAEILSRLFNANSYMERTITDLQRGVMKMRMVPINYAFKKLPKLVRDLSIEKGKRVRIDIAGKETEVDKGIVDGLGEPLTHLMRNFIDHGIESPELRRAAGKPEEAVITLRAYHEAAQIVIEAADDGQGIDVEKIKNRAVQKGMLPREEAEKIPDKDAISLIFTSGLSTSDSVSETSGRGIGMDIVKAAIAAMKGTIEVDSRKGIGTVFRLRLPLTLAIIKALLFEAGHRHYALPISYISEVTRVSGNTLTTVGGKTTLMLRDRIISMIDLDDLFGLNGGGLDRRFALILGIGGKKVGILIDRLIGQQELVIKAVNSDYTRSDLATGASILGNGKVVLILDAAAILRRAVREEKKGVVEV